MASGLASAAWGFLKGLYGLQVQDVRPWREELSVQWRPRMEREWGSANTSGVTVREVFQPVEPKTLEARRSHACFAGEISTSWHSFGVALLTSQGKRTCESRGTGDGPSAARAPSKATLTHKHPVSLTLRLHPTPNSRCIFASFASNTASKKVLGFSVS